MPPKALLGLTLAVALALTSCSSGSDDQPAIGPDKTARIPGAAPGTDFDDLTYSPRLGRLLVPALDAGVALVDPRSGEVKTIEGFGSADSVDEGRGLVFVTDRTRQELAVADPERREVVASVATRAVPDYVRYVASTGEVWVTEPGSIEVFSLDGGQAVVPRSDGLIRVADGSEGLAIDSRGERAYTQLHTGDVAVVDVRDRKVVATWPTGCDSVHGFPRLDERDGVLLTGCADQGEVHLLDVAHGGAEVGSYDAGGGAAILAYSPTENHFYVRGDPGDAIVALEGSSDGLNPVGRFSAPPTGHCLAADDLGHLWACDPEAGAVQRFTDGY